MRRADVVVVLSVASLLAVGCGSSLVGSDGGPSGSGGTSGTGGSSGSGCPTIQGSCRDRTARVCTEFGGLDAAALMAVRDQCMADTFEPGTWSSTGCTHAGVVGGCRLAELGGCVTGWGYTGPTADWMFACAERGGTWLNP